MHLVRAARQGGVVVLMSYVRRLRALGACHEPVKVARVNVLMSYVPCLLYFMCMNLLSSKLLCRALMSRHGSVGRLTVTV